ncbi:MAG: FAD-dependent oxidoreductase [Hyphomicrobiaceae bacterium]
MQPASTDLPTPDFSYNPRTDLVAGIRPYRKVSFRLEAEPVGDKFVVHNYGHGGAGITMAPGCAHEVRDIVKASGRATAGTPVAILGGGIMGLTAATVLRDMGLKVSMYAKAFSDTTSDRAGGQWSPSFVEFGHTLSDKSRFERILRRAFRGFTKLIGKDFGVSRRSNFTWHETAGFRKVPLDLIPPPTKLARLPFRGHTSPGLRYETLLIEPQIYLQRLRRELFASGVTMRPRAFSAPQQIMELHEPIVINCTGLGSREIWPDNLLIPIKGQLIMLPAQPRLKYLYSGYRGYIFPRQDHVVVGGTFERYVDNDMPVERMCAEIIRLHEASFFGKLALTAWGLPDWLYHDYD